MRIFLNRATTSPQRVVSSCPKFVLAKAIHQASGCCIITMSALIETP